MLVILFLWKVLDKKNRDVILGSSAVKESTCNAGDPGLILGSERSTGEGIGYPLQYSWAFLVAQLVKKSTCNVGNLASIPGLGRSPGEVNGYLLQYSDLKTLKSMGSQRVRHDGVTYTHSYTVLLIPYSFNKF